MKRKRSQSSKKKIEGIDHLYLVLHELERYFYPVLNELVLEYYTEPSCLNRHGRLPSECTFSAELKEETNRNANVEINMHLRDERKILEQLWSGKRNEKFIEVLMRYSQSPIQGEAVDEWRLIAYSY